MMKKVYKKSPDTDQSNQSDTDNSTNKTIITPENGSVKQHMYVIDINTDSFKKNADQITKKELHLIEDLMLYKKIKFSSGHDYIAAEVQKLEQLGIFTISEANKHERL